jgi:sortase B
MPQHSNTTKSAPKGGLLSRLLLIVGIALLVAALAIGGYVVWQYVDAQNHNAQIRSVAGLEVNFPEIVDASTTLEDLVFDWDALRAVNPDVVGWVIIPGTSINYPVVQGKDNSYYLYHLFDDASSGTGAVFADYEGSPTLDATNNIIYGHNVFDGTMFSNLVMYTSQDFFDEHRTVFLCTPAKNFELSAIATINIRSDAPLRQFSFESPAAFTAYLEDTLATPESAAADLRTQIASCQQFYSLVTCQTLDGATRITLCCVPVQEAVPKK